MSGMVASFPGAGGFRPPVAAVPSAEVRVPVRRRATGLLLDAVAPSSGWPVAAMTLVPAFFHRGPLPGELASPLLLAFLGLSLALAGAALLAGHAAAGGGSTAGRAGGAPLLLLGLFTAAAAAPGIAVLAGVAALCQAARHTVPPLRPPVRLLLTALTAALAFDAGSLALGTARGPDLLAWVGAVAVFGELLAGGLHCPDGSRPARRRSAIRREVALAFAGLAALTLYFLRLPPTGTTTPWETAAAYTAFGFFLLALWRGLRRTGGGIDAPTIGAVAGWAASSGFANGSLQPGSLLALP